MADPAASPQYYVGVGGQQTGPYSDADLVLQIQQQQIPDDALIWADGMDDWVPITSIPSFQEAFGGGTAQELTKTELPSGARMLEVPAGAKTTEVPVAKMSFAKKAAANEAVFKVGGAPSVKRRAGPSRKTVLSLLSMGLVLGSAFYLYSSWDDLVKEIQPLLAKLVPESSRKDRTVEVTQADPRETELRRAQSELLLQPEASVQSLRKLAIADRTDAIGKEALENALAFYRQSQRFADAGRLMSEMKEHEEAAKFFLMEPPSLEEAEGAIFAAYEASQPKKRDLLVRDIGLLLGPLQKMDLAEERIRALEKNHPGKHPFGYYLKTPDEKIADLFGRISFHFVQSLLQHIASEFPALGLESRPLVEITRDGSGRLLVQGKYRGNVRLNRDQLKDVRFVFWLVDEAWVVVETNLTDERRRVASAERSRRQGKGLDTKGMLTYLQNIFRQKFPKTGLHEAVTAKADPSKTLE